MKLITFEVTHVHSKVFIFIGQFNNGVFLSLVSFSEFVDVTLNRRTETDPSLFSIRDNSQKRKRILDKDKSNHPI